MSTEKFGDLRRAPALMGAVQLILRMERDRSRKSASRATLARVSMSSGSNANISEASAASARSTAVMTALRPLASRIPR
jgi:hypothetical protein